MIRFLQKDNRLVKSIFIVIIGAAVITMVITLIPGIFQNVSNTADTFATVYPHWYSRYVFAGDTISATRTGLRARGMIDRKGSWKNAHRRRKNFSRSEDGAGTRERSMRSGPSADESAEAAPWSVEIDAGLACGLRLDSLLESLIVAGWSSALEIGLGGICPCSSIIAENQEFL